MRVYGLVAVLIALLFVSPACKRSALEPDVDTDTQVDTDTDTDLDSEVGTDTDADTDSESDSDIDTDSDASVPCGNGLLDDGELCDVGIAPGQEGACPQTCDDSDACTTEVISGTECMTECVTGTVDTCTDGDGCCAPGCTALTDSECAPECGNAVVEGDELCDGDCPATCDDADVCTTDILLGDPLDCDVACVSQDIVACIDGDGCCAPGCDATLDSDCSADCGNGVVEGDEACDGNCPDVCADFDSCTTDRLVGTADACTAECVFDPVTECVSGDGCCADGCDATVDDDCASECGNGVTEDGEDCDDGNQDSNDACDACSYPDVQFRVTDLDLRDPHVFADFPFVGCTDATDQPFGQDGVNPLIAASIAEDDNQDGVLDLSLLLTFPQRNPSALSGPVVLTEGNCTAPVSATVCSPRPGAAQTPWTFARQTSGTCLVAVPGTLQPYSPALATPSAPCFVTDATSVVINTGLVSFTLQDSQFGATDVGDPASAYTNGLLRGFLIESEAEANTFPSTVPFIGGATLASVLRGHATNCSTTSSDMDTHPIFGDGWWMYFNVSAERVLGP